MTERNLRSRFSVVVASAAVAALTLLVMAASAAVAVPPTIDAEWVSGITSSNATLHAEINPHGLLTKYKLQIDTTGHFKFDQNDSCVLHPPGVFCAQVLVSGEPLPPGLVEPAEATLAASEESQHVSVNLATIGATLQPGTTYHYRAIASNGSRVVEGPDQTFTTPPGTAPPSIGRVWTTDIASDGATLNASINPNGRYTGYWLQIDSDADYDFTQYVCPFELPGYARCLSILPGEPLPDGLVEPEPAYMATGYGSQNVSVDVGVLQPDTTYHFRAVASNDGSVIQGSDQTFTTPESVPPPTGPPTIDAEWVSGITSSNATLHAEINPHGLLTKYKLQIDTTGHFKFDQNDSCVLHPPGVFCAQVLVSGEPLPPGLVEPAEATLAASEESQHVSVNLATIGATLQPGTTYHYRAIASNGSRIVEGPDQTFTTPGGSVPPPPAESEGGEEAMAGPSADSGGDTGSPEVTAIDLNPFAGRSGPAKAANRCNRRRQHMRRPGNHGHGPRRRCVALAAAKIPSS